MNLLRSICCLFAGRRAEEEPKPTKETVRGDLGQTEAELEKAGKERMELALVATILVRRHGDFQRLPLPFYMRKTRRDFPRAIKPAAAPSSRLR